MSLLSRLVSERSQKKSELKKYIQRKSELEYISKSVNGGLDNEISASIKNNNLSAASLGVGIQGDISTINSLKESINDLKEKYVWQDRLMSDAADNINSEVSRCKREIERLESEIRSLNRRIEEEREAEREAEKEG